MLPSNDFCPLLGQDRIDFGILMLADCIEAATRSGRPAEAKAAFERLAVRATAAAAPLGLGTLARCRAFLSDQEEAEGYYRESIIRLADANSAMELARSHLVLGEWLRRQRRRRDARLQLKIAYGMFSDIGATGFSERARIEFLATGGAARVRGVETANDLTPQETQIAGLVASGETNREVAAKLFISPAQSTTTCARCSRSSTSHLEPSWPGRSRSGRPRCSRPPTWLMAGKTTDASLPSHLYVPLRLSSSCLVSHRFDMSLVVGRNVGACRDTCPLVAPTVPAQVIPHQNR